MGKITLAPGRRLVPCATAVSLVGLSLLPVAQAASADTSQDGALPACTASWTGNASRSDWNLPENWSTDQVPGPQSDVCIATTVYTYVFATGNIVVHSLQISGGGGLELGETTGAPIPSRLDATDLVDNASGIGLYESTLESPKITSYDLAGNDASGGTSTVTSPAFTNTGVVDSLGGTLKLTDAPMQLSGGTLSGGQWAAFGGGSTLDLPGQITDLAGGNVGMVNGGQILSGGSSAFTGLRTIGPNATLDVAANSQPLQISGNLTSSGSLILGDYDSSGSVAIAGTYTDKAGAITSLAAGSNLEATQLNLYAGSMLSGGNQSVIEANVYNDGSFGSGGQVLRIAGNYTQASGGSIGAGNGYQVSISGHANLAGALDVLSGFPPAPGTKSTALTFASRTGDFTSNTIGFRIVAGSTQIDVVAQSQVALSPTSAAPGSTITVSGGDFPYESTVDLYLDRVGGTLLGTARTSFHGFFQTSVAVPSSTSAGNHTVIAVDGSLTVRAGFKVF
jgi:hypothetical protein